MSSPAVRLLCFTALSMAAWAVVPGRALAADAPADPYPPRLYTNADLEMFGPPSAPSADAPAPRRDAEAWEFVEGFLERQRRKLEAHRMYELEREALEGLRRACEAERDRYVAPFLGVYGTSFLAVPFRFPRLDKPSAPPPQVPSPHGRPFDPRDFMSQRPTLHARPPLHSR